MATLTDTARTILSAAAARDDLRVLPLPETLRAPAHIVTKTVQALLERGLIAQVAAGPDDPVWTEREDGRTTLVVTPAGVAAIGIDTEGAAADASPSKRRTGGKTRGGPTPATRDKAASRAAIGPIGAKVSKQDAVIALLRRQQGASVAEMMQATGWLAHSVRGFMSGALKKRLSLEVISEKDGTGQRRYYIAPIKAPKH